jgi:hypothetical protein
LRTILAASHANLELRITQRNGHCGYECIAYQTNTSIEFLRQKTNETFASSVSSGGYLLQRIRDYISSLIRANDTHRITPAGYIPSVQLPTYGAWFESLMEDQQHEVVDYHIKEYGEGILECKYADFIELECLSRFLHIKLAVYQIERGQLRLVCNLQEDINEFRQAQQIKVILHDQHYDLLQDMQCEPQQQQVNLSIGEKNDENDVFGFEVSPNNTGDIFLFSASSALTNANPNGVPMKTAPLPLRVSFTIASILLADAAASGAISYREDAIVEVIDKIALPHRVTSIAIPLLLALQLHYEYYHGTRPLLHSPSLLKMPCCSPQAPEASFVWDYLLSQ